MLRVGVIGCGGMGRDHIKRITERTQGAQVDDVSDVFEAGAKKASEIAGLAKVYTSGKDLINDPEVDELLLKARTSLDDQERLDCYKQLAEMNKENVWYLMVLTTYNSIVINKDLKGVVPIPAGYYNPAFYYWI